MISLEESDVETAEGLSKIQLFSCGVKKRENNNVRLGDMCDLNMHKSEWVFSPYSAPLYF